MPRFLRVTRQARWLKHPDLTWLSPDEIQADALGDLQTRNNALSVYKVEDESETRRVVVALAANRDMLANLDYAVFDGDSLPAIGVRLDQQDGATPDAEANKLHYDIREHTAKRLTELARVVSCAEHKRVPVKKVKDWLQNAVQSGSLERERLKESLLNKLT